MSIRRQHLVIVKGLASTVAVLAAGSLGLSTVIRDAASTTPAPARADDRAVPLEQVSNEPRTPAIEGHADSLVIREAHSDGGFWYWFEQQQGGVGGH